MFLYMFMLWKCVANSNRRLRIRWRHLRYGDGKQAGGRAAEFVTYCTAHRCNYYEARETVCLTCLIRTKRLLP
jgi:hypothetical protein